MIILIFMNTIKVDKLVLLFQTGSTEQLILSEQSENRTDQTEQTPNSPNTKTFEDVRTGRTVRTPSVRILVDPASKHHF